MPINSESNRKPYLNEQLQRGVAKAQQGGSQWADSDESRSQADPNRIFDARMADAEMSEAERIRLDEQFRR